MRTNARYVPAAAATSLLLIACAATVSCCKPHPDTHVSPKLVTVVVTYDSATKKAAMSDFDKTIRLSEKHMDRAQWVSPDGLVYVKFTAKSPFDSDPVHDKKVLKSGPPKRETAGQGFDYTAELALSDGSRVTIDPRIEIIP